MEKDRTEEVLVDLLSTGGDFAEVFLEEKEEKKFDYIDNKLDGFYITNSNGAGLRVAKDNNIYYAATNDFDSSNLKKIIADLKKNIKDKVLYKSVTLDKLKKYSKKMDTHYSDIDIKNKLKEINDMVWKKDERINQVHLSLQNTHQTVTIANQTGRYVTEDRIRTRLFIIINLKDNDKMASVSFNKGLSTNYDEVLDTIDYEKEIDNLVKSGIDKLYAKPCIGKVMPVILGPGFGGVIFHEACGHAMEATSVADRTSVLTDKLNENIASSKVTIIDDGTIDNAWGSTQIDDEGHETQVNTLIKDGVLKSYLVDELNSRKMNHEVTGSGRRESYRYAPTSRMNNTYLAAGTEKIEDMIASIDLGLYAIKLGGGCVSTSTGDFNFACDTAYMIRDGKIAECVKSASLIGNTKSILNEVEMVSDDLSLGQGYCGSLSGNVPVNVGEPTIKVGHILVGGVASEE